MIKLESLRVFVTVAEAGNIRDAANRLGRTASAISMTLKQLEEEIGGALFETDRKSSLTALGTFILDTGRVQVRSYDRAVARMRSYARNRIGRLTLAAVPSVATHLLPGLLPGFMAGRPEVELDLLDMDSENVRLVVEAGQADLGLSGQPSSTALVRFEPLFRDRFQVVCRAEDRLAALGRPVQWSDLSPATLIVNGSSSMIEAPEYRMLEQGTTRTVRNVMSLLALTRSGFGVTLLPALVTKDLPSGIVALDLAYPDIGRTVGIVERRGGTPSPVAAAFREHIVEALPELYDLAGTRLS